MKSSTLLFALLVALAVPTLCVLGLRGLASRWRPLVSQARSAAEPSPRRLALALDVSALGSATLTSFFAALFAVALLLHTRWLGAVVYALMVFLAGLSATWLKRVAAHARLEGARTLTFGTSFPSTHTALAVTCYGGALLTAWPLLDNAPARIWVAGAGLLTIAAVAASRIWLGAHRRRDVLAGLALGVSFLVPTAVVVLMPHVA